MTTIILSTVIAAALGAANPPAQADTVNMYIIDASRVEHFDGSQLQGKTIAHYKIHATNIGGEPALIHEIITEEYSKRLDPMGEPTIISAESPSISIRTTGNTVSAEDIVYVLDGVPVTYSEFKALDPKNISSIEVVKGGSTAKKLQEFREQGRLKGEINMEKAANGVIFVTTKKGSK